MEPVKVFHIIAAASIVCLVLGQQLSYEVPEPTGEWTFDLAVSPEGSLARLSYVGPAPNPSWDSGPGPTGGVFLTVDGLRHPITPLTLRTVNKSYLSVASDTTFYVVTEELTTDLNAPQCLHYGFVVRSTITRAGECDKLWKYDMGLIVSQLSLPRRDLLTNLRRHDVKIGEVDSSWFVSEFDLASGRQHRTPYQGIYTLVVGNDTAMVSRGKSDDQSNMEGFRLLNHVVIVGPGSRDVIWEPKGRDPSSLDAVETPDSYVFAVASAPSNGAVTFDSKDATVDVVYVDPATRAVTESRHVSTPGGLYGVDTEAVCGVVVHGGVGYGGADIPLIVLGDEGHQTVSLGPGMSFSMTARGDSLFIDIAGLDEGIPSTSHLAYGCDELRALAES